MNEEVVAFLDGYLHALRRLTKNRCDFWAESFDVDGDIEKSFRCHLGGDISLTGKEVVKFKEISKTLNDYLFGRLFLNDADDIVSCMRWDIEECIQSSFSQIEPEIDPIYEGRSLLFNASSSFHEKYVYIVVPVISKAIVIGLASRF